jgi:group I intron endonuclease
MIGIYKITSPNNKIYIGQSIDIDFRFKKYQRLACSKQPKLYYSFIKYGIINHKFEIIEECSLEYLNEKEIYWGLKFDVLSEKGLNLKLGNAKGKCSQETKDKIGLGNKGKNLSQNAKNKISKSLKGRKNIWYNNKPGYIYTEEQKIKMRNPRKSGWDRENLIPPPIVEEIRLKYSTGNYTKSDLHREYGVSWGTIKNITNKLNSYKD